MISAQTTGDVETAKKLEQLGVKVEKKILAKSVRAGGAPAVKAAKRNMPVRSKALKQSVTQKVKRFKTSVVSITGARSRKTASGVNPAKYLHLVEGGTRRHEIRSRGLALRIGRFFTGQVDHPGARAQRPIQRAQQETKQKSIAAFGDKLKTETDAEVRRLA